MDTRKLLIADPTAEVGGVLADLLGGTYTLRVCRNGIEARKLLDSFQPDVMVMDLALPGLDGVSLLKAAALKTPRPSILVTTLFLSPYIENAVRQIGADYLMMKPYDIHAMVERIHDLLECSPEEVFSPPSAGVTVANMLLALNVSTKSRAFQCLEMAIELYGEDPCQSVTKVLYPAVAKCCGGSSASVERAIRGAIHAAWERRDDAVWRVYFHPGRDGEVPRPTNTVFISQLAEHLRQQRQEWAM